MRPLLFPFLLLFCSELAAAQGTPRATATALPPGVERPTIDGRVTEAAWDLAQPIDAFRQVVPVAGAEPSERTEARLLFDERSIFLALRCFDSDPNSIRATQAKRDADLEPDDRVEFFFDPFLDRRNGFWFQIGPAGSRGDALITRNGSRFNKQWDGIWFGRARITDDGWEAEVELPVATINFDPKAEDWGFNIRRFIRRRNEEVRWASPTPKISFFSIANGGTLSGFRDLKQGIGLDVKPFALADYSTSDGDDELEGDTGLDLFYRISPTTKLSLSFNTDFAETEVDERRVNLTRFPLFFPEKRDFFLEDSGVFVFGPSSRRGADVIPFFSRRIGIDENGEVVPLLASAKLTGQTDQYSYGVLGVQTDELGELDSQSLFVGRFSLNVFDQSDVGAIVTAGDPNDNGGQTTYGVDYNYRTDEFRNDDNLRFSTYYVRTEADTEGGGGNAYHASVDYPNDQIQLSAGYTVVEDEFEPVLGFVRRSGIKKYESRLAWRPRLYSAIRQLTFRVEPTLFTDSGNKVETARVFIQPLRVEFESDDDVFTFVNLRHEALDEDFDIGEGVTIDADEYDFVRYGAGVNTSAKRPVSVGLEWRGGTFFDGDRVDYQAEVEVRVSARATIGGEYEINDIDLPGGDFQVQIARGRLDLQFGPDVSWSNFVQWDSESDLMGLNSRVWWIIRPGNEFFFVVNQGWRVDDRTFDPEDTEVTAKLGLTFRL